MAGLLRQAREAGLQPKFSNQPQMTDRLCSLIAKAMQVQEDDVDENSNLETLRTWDSGREVELAMMLEFEFGIKLTDDEMASLHSVRDVRAMLASRGVHA